MGAITVPSTVTSNSRVTRLRPRLTLVEQHTAFAELLEARLWGTFQTRSVIVEPHSTVTGTVAAARGKRPDLVLVNTRLGPFLHAEAVIDGLAAHGLTVIALADRGADDDPVVWGRCLRAGALGVVSLTHDLATLRSALAAASSGQAPHDAAEIARLLDAAHQADRDETWSARSKLERLSMRELEIVAELVAGRCTAVIARECFVAEATVRCQIKSILAKLEVRSQLAAVALAFRAGWPEPGTRALPLAS